MFPFQPYPQNQTYVQTTTTYPTYPVPQQTVTYTVLAKILVSINILYTIKALCVLSYLRIFNPLLAITSLILLVMSLIKCSILSALVNRIQIDLRAALR